MQLDDPTLAFQYVATVVFYSLSSRHQGCFAEIHRDLRSGCMMKIQEGTQEAKLSSPFGVACYNHQGLDPFEDDFWQMLGDHTILSRKNVYSGSPYLRT